MSSFTIEAAALRKAASAARGIVTTNKAIAVLNNVRIDAASGSLRLLATDQDCWAEITTSAIVGDSVSTTVAANLFDDIAKNAPPGAQVEIALTDAGATAKAGRAKFRLPTLPVDSFPPMNDHGIGEQVRVETAALLAGIAAVAHVRAEEHQHHLHGVLIRPADGGLEVAAFDGKRLSRAPVAAQVADDFACMTIPLPVVSKLRAILDSAGDEITIGHNGRLALIQGGGLRFLTRLVEGVFTPYWNRLPTLDGEPVLFSSKELNAALNRVGLVQDRHYSGTVLELSRDTAKLSLANHALGDVSEIVPVGYSGPDVRIGYNLRFLKDAVANCPGDEAELHIDADRNAHIFARAPGSPHHMIAKMAI